MVTTPEQVRGWRNRTKVALACAVVSASAMLPVACGVPGGAEAEAGAQPKATASPTPSVDDAAAVKQAYLDFEQAGDAKDAAAAVALMSESSKQYYEELRKLALTATKAKLVKRPVVDQITVLQLRRHAEPAVLRDGDLVALVEVSMESAEDLPADTGDSSADVAEAKVAVKGDVATMTDSTDAETPPMKLVREGGGWKVDIRSVMAGLSEAIDGLVELSGATKTEFLEQAATEAAGSAAKGRKLWKPIGTGTT